MRTWLIVSVLILSISLSADKSPFKCDGILGDPVTDIDNMNFYAAFYIPYNSIIVEVGAYKGNGTHSLSKTYPYAKIFAFEANPETYATLSKQTKYLKNVSAYNLAITSYDGVAKLWGTDRNASLLNIDQLTKSIEVPCISLEHWCEENNIKKIDFLRLDAGGIEWQILHSSPNILETVKVLVTKTYLAPSRKAIVSFNLLKVLLEECGFELHTHWYEEGKTGEACFVRKEIFDAMFR